MLPMVIKPAIRDDGLLCSSLEYVQFTVLCCSEPKHTSTKLSEGKITSMKPYIGLNFRSSCEFHIATHDNLIHWEGLTHALCNGPGPAGQHLYVFLELTMFPIAMRPTTRDATF